MLKDLFVLFHNIKKHQLLLIGVFAVAILFLVIYDTIDTYFTVTIPLQHTVQLDYIGEYHYDPTDDPQSNIGTVTHVETIDEEYIEIQFTDNDFFVGQYEIPEFEHTEIIKKGNVFVETCLNFESGVSLGLLTYMGIEKYNEKDHYKFFRTSTNADKNLQCKYPQVITESLKIELDIIIPQGKILNIILEK